MLHVNRRRALQLGTSVFAGAIAECASGALAGTVLCGCAPSKRYWQGVDVSSGQEIRIDAGAMPANASFTGTYRSPQTGDLVLSQEGANLTGQFRYADGSAVGTLAGRVTGNVAEITWQERANANAASPSLAGTGYFLFDVVSSSTGRARLFGGRVFHVGQGSSTTTRDGGPWTAVRVSP